MGGSSLIVEPHALLACHIQVVLHLTGPWEPSPTPTAQVQGAEVHPPFLSADPALLSFDLQVGEPQIAGSPTPCSLSSPVTDASFFFFFFNILLVTKELKTN